MKRLSRSLLFLALLLGLPLVAHAQYEEGGGGSSGSSSLTQGCATANAVPYLSSASALACTNLTSNGTDTTIASGSLKSTTGGFVLTSAGVVTSSATMTIAASASLGASLAVNGGTGYVSMWSGGIIGWTSSGSVTAASPGTLRTAFLESAAGVIKATAGATGDARFINGIGNSVPEYTAGNAGAAPAIDWANGATQFWTLNTASMTWGATPSNPADGTTYLLYLLQDSTGSRCSTCVWPTGFTWPGGTAPTLTTTAAALDLVSCKYRSSTSKYLCIYTTDIR